MKSRIALFLQLAAAGLGIILAEMFNIRLVKLFLPGSNIHELADVILTGIVIGGGSQPIHVLIRFLTTRKLPVTEEVGQPEALSKDSIVQAVEGAVKATVTETDEGHWLPIPYDGGVNPESLEYKHIRKADPDLIVYHHTAMSSNLNFKAVVDEFLVNKKWSTGYNCVIMPDGTIKPFCRWDRYGNHALGLNPRSLGISFHGNFHTLPGDKFSNYDGRFGIQRPTPAQVAAGARIVALWVHLYPNIKLDFNKDILPHGKAIPGHTVCPGSNFPHAEFQSRVKFFYDNWKKSAVAKEQIASFKQKPYIYS